MPIDFADHIARRRAGYTPRPWLTVRIAGWFGDPHRRRRFFGITGEPGSGKTAVAAELCAGPPDPRLPRIAAYHFCSSREANWREPLAFVQSMSLQLAERVPGFREALQARYRARYEIHATGSAEATANTGINVGVMIEIHAESPETAFRLAVLEPLEQLYATGFDEDVVLLIDAIDEGDLFKGPGRIGSLVEMCSILPRKVSVIVTSRPKEYLDRFRGNDDLEELSLGAPDVADEVRRDVERHVRRTVETNGAMVARFAATLPVTKFVEVLRVRADGNFLWLTVALEMLGKTSTPITIETLQRLPTGLPGLYSEFLTRIAGDDMQRWRREYSLVLGTLAVAQEEMTVDQLAHYTGLAAPVVHQIVDDTVQLLEPVAAGDSFAYRLYHLSFTEYILDVREAKKFACVATEQHARIAARWKPDTDPRQWDRSDDYAIRHIVAHLFELRNDPAWCDVLFGLLARDWMEAKRARLLTDVSFARDVSLIAVAAGSVKPPRTADRIRAFCILGTLRSRVAAIPSSALALMARLGDPDRALSYASLLDDSSRATTEMEIAVALAESDPARAEAIVRTIVENGAAPDDAREELLRIKVRRGNLDDAFAIARTLAPPRVHSEGALALLDALLAAGRFQMARELAALPEDEHARRTMLGTVLDAVLASGEVETALAWSRGVDLPDDTWRSIVVAAGAQDLARSFRIAVSTPRGSAAIDALVRSAPPAAVVAAVREAGVAEDVGYYAGVVAVDLASRGDGEGARQLLTVAPEYAAQQVITAELRLRIEREGFAAADAIVAEAAEHDRDTARAAVGRELAVAGAIADAARHLGAIASEPERIQAAREAIHRLVDRDKGVAAAIELATALDGLRMQLLIDVVGYLRFEDFNESELVSAAAGDDAERREIALAIGRVGTEQRQFDVAVAAWRETKPWPEEVAGELAAALIGFNQSARAVEIAEAQPIAKEHRLPVCLELVRLGHWQRALALADSADVDRRFYARILLADPAAASVSGDFTRALADRPDIVAEAVRILARRGQNGVAAGLAYQLKSEAMLARCIREIASYDDSAGSRIVDGAKRGVVPLEDAVHALMAFLDFGDEANFKRLAEASAPAGIGEIAVAVEDAVDRLRSGEGQVGAELAKFLPGTLRAEILIWLAARPDTTAEARSNLLDIIIPTLRERRGVADLATEAAVVFTTLMPPEGLRSRFTSLTVDWTEVVARCAAAGNTPLAIAILATVESTYERDRTAEAAIALLTDEHAWAAAASLLPAREFRLDEKRIVTSILAESLVVIGGVRIEDESTKAVPPLREVGCDLDAILRDRTIAPPIRAAVALGTPGIQPYAIQSVAEDLIAIRHDRLAVKLLEERAGEASEYAHGQFGRAFYRLGGLESLSWVAALSPEMREKVASDVASDLLEKDPAEAARVFLGIVDTTPLSWGSDRFVVQLAARGELETALRILDRFGSRSRADWTRINALEAAAGRASIDLLFDSVWNFDEPERSADALSRVIARLAATDGTRFAKSMWDAWGREVDDPRAFALIAKAFLDAGDEPLASEMLGELVALGESVVDDFWRNQALSGLTRFFLDQDDERAVDRAIALLGSRSFGRRLALQNRARYVAAHGDLARAHELLAEALEEADDDREAARIASIAVDLGGDEKAREALTSDLGPVPTTWRLIELADALEYENSKHVRAFGPSPAERESWLGSMRARLRRNRRTRDRRIALRAAFAAALTIGSDEFDAAQARALAAVGYAAAGVHPRLARKALARAKRVRAIPALDQLYVAAVDAISLRRMGKRVDGGAVLFAVRDRLDLVKNEGDIPFALTVAASLGVAFGDVPFTIDMIDRALALPGGYFYDALTPVVARVTNDPQLARAAASHLRSRVDEAERDGYRRAATLRAIAHCAVAIRDRELLEFAREGLAAVEPNESASTTVDVVGELIDSGAGVVIGPWLATSEDLLRRHPYFDSASEVRATLAAHRLRLGNQQAAEEAMWAAFAEGRLGRRSFFAVLDRVLPILYALDEGTTLRAVADGVLDAETWWPHRPEKESRTVPNPQTPPLPY